MFEGLGLGSRLAVMRLPQGCNWVRYAGALVYCICTPVGMAAGLGAIQSFNGNAATSNLTTGILDAFSAGILLYTGESLLHPTCGIHADSPGLVELIAHEILFNTRMMNASAMKLTYVFGCMMLGSGLMALLGKWA
jgi:zinc transporter 1/2/3